MDIVEVKEGKIDLDDYVKWYVKKYHWGPSPDALVGLKMYLEERNKGVESEISIRMSKLSA